MMSTRKKTWIAIALVAIGIQAVQPSRDRPGSDPDLSLATSFPVDQEVLGILRTSCYDCHSNNTRFPWYSSIQPVGWWLNNHIREGRSELNFDAFGGYSNLRRQSKLRAIASTIRKGEMPLSSYTLIHRAAKLSDSEKRKVLAWADHALDSLSKN